MKMQSQNQPDFLKPDKFKNKYKINSTRLKYHDYSSDGVYFITICEKDRKCAFGNIKENQMFLSPYGKIAEDYLKEIPGHYSFMILEEFVVMPNHVHVILIIDKEYSWDGHKKPDDTDGMDENKNIYCGNPPCRDAINRVSTKGASMHGGITGENNPMLNAYSLSNVIRWYKGRVSFEISKNFPNQNFHWQERFYDIIIKNPESHNKIRWYVLNNVLRWEEDGNNPRFFEGIK